MKAVRIGMRISQVVLMGFLLLLSLPLILADWLIDLLQRRISVRHIIYANRLLRLRQRTTDARNSLDAAIAICLEGL